MSDKHSIDVGARIIDEDYTGEVKVLLINHSDKQYHIREGDRIVQLILEQIKTPETKMTTELKPTIRGNKGFGSTGISTCLVTIDNTDITDEVSNQSEKKHTPKTTQSNNPDTIRSRNMPTYSQKRSLLRYHTSERLTTLSILSTRINTDICGQDAYDQAKHSYLS